MKNKTNQIGISKKQPTFIGPFDVISTSNLGFTCTIYKHGKEAVVSAKQLRHFEARELVQPTSCNVIDDYRPYMKYWPTIDEHSGPESVNIVDDPFSGEPVSVIAVHEPFFWTCNIDFTIE